jgi:Ca2+-binding EF-hand superfamily protein
MYDFDGDGKISTPELTSLVAATLREHGVVISRSHIDEIVAATMKTPGLAEPGYISFEE